MIGWEGFVALTCSSPEICVGHLTKHFKVTTQLTKETYGSLKNTYVLLKKARVLLRKALVSLKKTHVVVRNIFDS